MKTVFLGWERPGLASTVEILCREPYLNGTTWDLSRVVIVVPGGRAQRRLWELLAAQAAGKPDRPPLVLVPPRIVTPGRLFEELLPCSQLASELQGWLAWIAVLRGAEPGLLQRLFPSPPPREDFSAWATVAEEIERLYTELSGEGLTFADVAACCRSSRVSFCDADRWDVLAELHAAYLDRLKQLGLKDRHEARRTALITNEAVETGLTIYLLGVVDLNRVTRELLWRVKGRVVPLVYAPDELSAGFDDLGCLNPEWWKQEEIPLSEASLRVVDRPRDQAYAVVDVLTGLEGCYSADQITVGLGDAALGPTVERVLELVGVNTRSSVGLPLERSRPARLLAALMEYVANPRVDRFAALLRCPDVEEWLAHGPGRDYPDLVLQRSQWLAWLDKYIGEHLPLRLGTDGTNGADAVAAALKLLYETVERLAAPLRGEAKSLPEWSPDLTAVLGEVYRWRELDRKQDEALVRSLEAIGACLREQYEISSTRGLAPRLTGPEAVAFTLRRLAGAALPDPGGKPAVELLGWLELYLDDAPVLVVTGLNEGQVPESVNGDAFLPDRLRWELGLTDNQRRYARDALVLRTLLGSRASTTLISGRYGASGDPLVPSRLLFACDSETLVRRSLEFYGEGQPAHASRLLVRPGERNQFLIPPPIFRRRSLERLSVTAFRDYLRCPYRFYLRHVLKVDALDDRPVELDGRGFGNLAHEVLSGFGSSAVGRSLHPAEIREYLRDELYRRAETQFGKERTPAVELQLFQLQRRLERFAEWQVEHAREGWQVYAVERDLETLLSDPDGAPFSIYGRVDRIDYHEPTGRYLILDCKTSDNAQPPEKAHRQRLEGVLRWTDLQLPLYRRLATALDLDPVSVDVGYLCLPKDLKEIGLRRAEWGESDFLEAEAQALAVVRSIRAERYWPPSEESSLYADAYSGICLDHCVDRARIIAAGTQ